MVIYEEIHLAFYDINQISVPVWSFPQDVK